MRATMEVLQPIQRELGSYGTDAAGPLTVVIGGMHGNEPGGVLAARRVLAKLEEQRPRMTGRFLALSGNLKGLRDTKRYVDRDLNRVWTDVTLADLRAASGLAADVHEHSEQRELYDIIERELSAHDNAHAAVFLDLHSTSGGGPPFSIIGDTISNRRIAMALCMPVILGLEETIEGTLLGWLSSRGYNAIGIEGGQNDDPETVDNLEASIWLALVASGQLAPADVPDLEAYRARLARAVGDIPGVVEIRYRHGLDADERFEMEGRFSNFERIEKGQLLARSWTEDGSVEVRARESGLLLMPRYQGQGNDGFFVGRPVPRKALELSAWLRRLRTSAFLALLPGVSRPEGRYGPLHVNKRVARWFSVELFHLLGYRKHQEHDHHLVFTRRLERPQEPF